MMRPSRGAVNRYQTEPGASSHREASFSSGVDSTVVPSTVAGTSTACAFARLSLGGGSASATDGSSSNAAASTPTARPSPLTPGHPTIAAR